MVANFRIGTLGERLNRRPGATGQVRPWNRYDVLVTYSMESEPVTANRQIMRPSPLLLVEPERSQAPRIISEAHAVDIWIARWLRVRRIEILRRYNCDPRRLYEIWEGRKFPESRGRALKLFKERYPELVERTDFGNHRVIPRSHNTPEQMGLFDT